MAAAVVGQIYQVTLVGELLVQRIMNTFHYEVENVPVGGSTVAAAAAALEAAFEAPGGIIEKYLDCLPSNYTLNEMWIQCIGPTERYVKAVALQALEGASGFLAEMSNLAQVITRTTEKSGRSQVSSLHLPCGGTSDWLDGGFLAPTPQLTLAALAALLPNQIGGAPNLSFDPVIYHGPPPKLPADQIVAATGQDSVRVMRRRTVGLGI